MPVKLLGSAAVAVSIPGDVSYSAVEEALKVQSFTDYLINRTPLDGSTEFTIMVNVPVEAIKAPALDGSDYALDAPGTLRSLAAALDQLA